MRFQHHIDGSGGYPRDLGIYSRKPSNRPTNTVRREAGALQSNVNVDWLTQGWNQGFSSILLHSTSQSAVESGRDLHSVPAQREVQSKNKVVYGGSQRRGLSGVSTCRWPCRQRTSEFMGCEMPLIRHTTTPTSTTSFLAVERKVKPL